MNSLHPINYLILSESVCYCIQVEFLSYENENMLISSDLFEDISSGNKKKTVNPF